MTLSGLLDDGAAGLAAIVAMVEHLPEPAERASEGPRSLMNEREEALEAALWSALRALEERAELLLRLAHRMREFGYHAGADRFSEQHALAHRRAAVVREALGDAFVPSDRTPEAARPDDERRRPTRRRPPRLRRCAERAASFRS